MLPLRTRTAESRRYATIFRSDKMYDIKALYEAESVSDAIRLRLAHPEAQIIAGGSDVLVQMREGKRAGKELISIYMLDELRGVRLDEDDNIRIGSLTSFSHITRDPIIQQHCSVLGAASGSFKVTLDDGKVKRTFFLNRPYQGLYVKPGMWRDLEDFSSGAVCMVLASDVYRAEDYIRDYDEFLKFREIEK